MKRITSLCGYHVSVDVAPVKVIYAKYADMLEVNKKPMKIGAEYD